ncbi:unnamed protein product, partial [Ectocarpus sp. 8 AP-2014]
MVPVLHPIVILRPIDGSKPGHFFLQLRSVYCFLFSGEHPIVLPFFFVSSRCLGVSTAHEACTMSSISREMMMMIFHACQMQLVVRTSCFLFVFAGGFIPHAIDRLRQLPLIRWSLNYGAFLY